MIDSVKRTHEIEEFTNLHIIHPISSWLVPKLVAGKITPNMVSVIGMIFGILAGLAYAQYQTPYMAVAGFIFMFLWHIMDGADGQLARLTKNCSEIGKILDGVCDYVTFISVYVGIGIALSAEGGPEVWVIVISAGILHAIQSSAYELQRAEYDYWGYDKNSSALPEINHMRADLKGKAFFSFMMSQFYIFYIRMQRGTSGIDSNLRKLLKDTLMAHPDKTDDIRRLYRHVFAGGVRNWAILSANYRTIAIFLACSAGQPIYFFWFEIAILTPALLLLVQKQRWRNRSFSQRVREIR